MPIDIIIPKHSRPCPVVIPVDVGGGQGVLMNSIHDIMEEGINKGKFCYWRAVWGVWLPHNMIAEELLRGKGLRNGILEL